MFYQEEMIDGKLMCRTDPDGEWREVSKETLQERYNTLETECNDREQGRLNALDDLTNIKEENQRMSIQHREYVKLAEDENLALLTQNRELEKENLRLAKKIEEVPHDGLTKREEFAIRILAAIITPSDTAPSGHAISWVCHHAVEIADKLIAELNKES